MKLLTYFFTFAYLFTCSSFVNAKENKSEIIVVVNEKGILRSDLYHRIKLVAKTSGVEMSSDVYNQLKDRVLTQMINEALQRELVAKVDFTPTKDQVKNAWHNMERNFGLNEGGLDELLKNEKIPRRVIEDQITALIGWQTYIHERYGSLVQISEVDIQNEMKRIKQEKDRDQALLSELVVYYNSPGEAEKAKAKAAQLIEKIKEGSPFPIVAQQFSHSASAANGGDIGWVGVDQLDPNLKNAVQKLNKGDISDPIPVKNGYYVLGLRDRHGVGSLGNPVEYVSFQQVEFMHPLFGGKPAIEQTYIAAESTKKSCKTCSMLQKLTKDRPRINSRLVTRQPLDSLHPELQKVIQSLKPGEQSRLLNTGKSFIMFMLCDREVVKPHEPGKNDIKAQLLDKKLGMLAEREMRNLRRAAHIEKRA